MNFSNSSTLVSLLLLLSANLVWSSTKDNYASKGNSSEDEDSKNNGEEPVPDLVRISKCCETGEVLKDGLCTKLRETNETQPWHPEFEPEDLESDSKSVPAPKYKLKIGLPKCRNHQKPWDVYDDSSGLDKLAILPSGKLRHYISDRSGGIEKAKETYGTEFLATRNKMIHYDYPPGHYCTDKAILTRNKLVVPYAMVCVPEVKIKWENPDFLIKKAVNPAFHALAIISYLVVAVVYFVLPQLRDLVGNMISSLSMCLVINQVASFVRIFTQETNGYGSDVSFLVADSVMHISQLAAFFWLNAFGYYVWYTFRSRNVYLRVTDARKYLCYSIYVWGTTAAIAGTALFAHFTLEKNKPALSSPALESQETVGWLGLSVIFASIAFTVLINLSFVLTTMNRMQRMITYGRIHLKMKYCLRTFVQIYTLMTMGWLSTLFSQLRYDGIIYFHILVNALQGVLILYVCVFGQKRVMLLLSKTLNCYDDDGTEAHLDWGEEMTAFNAGY